LITPGYLPTNFTAYYYETANTNSGAVYSGSLSISPTALGVNYANDLRLVSISVSWKTGGLQRSRQLLTYASKYGIQRYVCN